RLPRPVVRSRRRFLTNIAGAGAVGLVGARAAGLAGGGNSLAAEPPPEITKLTLWEGPVTCGPQQWVAPELLYAEGFTDVQYYTWRQPRDFTPDVLLSGDVDISVSFIPSDAKAVVAREPVVWLGGSHLRWIV